MKHFLPIIVLSLMLIGCTSNTIYSHYESLPISGWCADSTIRFPFEITDSLAHYDMVVNLRHTDNYPFQNVWFFTELYLDSTLLEKDTLNYYLADQRGRWLGNGAAGKHDMPTLYKQNVRFASTGQYSLHVTHGMRTEQLNGCSDLGLTISLRPESN